MNPQSENSAPTFESVWATLQENAQQQKETERLMKEQFAAEEQRRKESEKKSEKKWEEFWKSMKAMQKELGGVGNSNGKVAESYFVNCFAKSMEFAGQKYDSMDSGLKRRIKSLNLQGEYDLLLYNCTSVVVIEIKYSADKTDVDDLLEKAPIFKRLYPQYANFDLYLGLAALHFGKGVEAKSKKQGIAVIKQVGKNMVIYDAHLKVW